MSAVTFAYMTSRKDCRFEWWADSLKRELGGSFGDHQIIVVDFWSQPMVKDGWKLSDVVARTRYFMQHCDAPNLLVTAPKPNVWQGQYRLPKDNWFAACNARNTAFILCQNDYIVFSDDLSVILPGWWKTILEDTRPNTIVCGAYQKVNKLVVENGNVVSFEDSPHGHDNRERHLEGRPPGPFECGGNWMFGCSFAMPIEAALAVNGYDENCGSLSFEDVIFGVRLMNAGYQFVYDPRMKTLESEELHAQGPVMKRTDKGQSPKDKSHAILSMAMHSKWAPNYFGEGGLRAVRERVLDGADLPMQQVPQHDWWDGQPVAEF